MAFRASKSMSNRILFIKIIASILVFVIAVSRIFSIVFVQKVSFGKNQPPKSLLELATEQHLSDIMITAPRGNIYDANMNLMANSSTVWTVAIDPANMVIKKNPEKQLK